MAGDQEGTRSYEKSVFANPLRPEICPVMACLWHVFPPHCFLVAMIPCRCNGLCLRVQVLSLAIYEITKAYRAQHEHTAFKAGAAKRAKKGTQHESAKKRAKKGTQHESAKKSAKKTITATAAAAAQQQQEGVEDEDEAEDEDEGEDEEDLDDEQDDAELQSGPLSPVSLAS